VSDSGKDRSIQVIEGEVIPANTPARTPRLRLGSIREIRRELVKIYEAAKSGKMPTQDASRLTFMLQTLSSMIKDSELEERISILEKKQNESKKQN
jgi:hypothetical protein